MIGIDGESFQFGATLALKEHPWRGFILSSVPASLEVQL